MRVTGPKTELSHLALAATLALSTSAHAATFTWDGTANTWPSIHWFNSGNTLVAGGSSSADSYLINGGTVSFAGNDTFGNAATTTSPTISIGAGGTLASAGFFSTIWNLNLNSGTVALTGGVNASYPAFQFAGTLTATGTSNINVVSGGFNAINIGGTGNGTLNMNVVNALDVLNVNAPLQNNPSGASSLTKTGLGTLTLSGANTYTGGTTVNGGTLSLVASGALPSGGGVAIGAGGRLSNAAPAGTSFALNGLTLTGGELAATSTPDVSLGNFYLNGNVTVGGSARSTISADLRVIANQTRDFNVGVTGDSSGVDLLISGQLGHQNNVAWGYGTKSGAGVMKLSGGNWLGGMTVSVGRLILEDNAIGWTYPVNGLVNNSQLEFSVTSGSRSYGANLGGSGALFKTGNGTMTLTAANAYTGNTTTIITGTLQIGAAGTAGSITTTSNVVNNAALVFNRTDTYGGNFTPVISGSGSLTLANGTLTLAGANTYTGETLVNGGTVLLSGTISGATTVNSGGTLGGSGGTAGNVTVNSGGTLSPGVNNSIGELTVWHTEFQQRGSLPF